MKSKIILLVSIFLMRRGRIFSTAFPAQVKQPSANRYLGRFQFRQTCATWNDKHPRSLSFPLSRLQTVRYFSSSTSPTSSPSTRNQFLQESLTAIGVDANDLHEASMSSIQDPTAGYDNNYGKPAIRAYRSFIFPKKEEDMNSIALAAAARRCAQQINFLIKRFKSHQTEWVRHHDEAAKSRRVFPLILVLDNVRSAFNVGSLFRTADACGCQLVLTTGITPHPNGNGADKLAKSALGAEYLVPSQHFTSTKDAIAYLRKEMPEFKLVGMETTEHSQAYTDLEYSPNVVLVLGNEVTGVDTEIMRDLDSIVEIPMFGAKNSLNVAACAPVVLYEILRQWNV
jgi:23S rRNA (guanosine2251-2'-O)-methyltransferase